MKNCFKYIHSFMKKLHRKNNIDIQDIEQLCQLKPDEAEKDL